MMFSQEQKFIEVIKSSLLKFQTSILYKFNIVMKVSSSSFSWKYSHVSGHIRHFTRCVNK